MNRWISRLRQLEERMIAGVPVDRQWRARIAVRSALAVAPWGFFYAFVFLALGFPVLAGSLALAGVIVGSSPFVLRTTGSVDLTGHLITAGLVQSLVAPTWLLGGLFAACLPWLAFCTMIATVVAGRRGGIVWSVICLLLVAGLYAAFLTGVLPEPIVDVEVHWFLAFTTHGGFFIIVGVLVVAATTAVERQRVALEQARAEALEASRTKSTFLANMSHELRTPMNAILGYAEMLAEEADGEDVRDLQRIQDAGRHLLGLVNDVLDLSKVEAGQMDFAIERVDAVEVANQVLDQAAGLVQAQANTAILVQDGPVWVNADATRLFQCVLNLVSNAAKFTANGAVTVRVVAIGDHVQLLVEDTGEGMTADQLAGVFEPFVQVGNGVEGTGLGLAIVKQFVERMGGSVRAESTPGGGSTFVLLLQAAPT